MTMTVCITCDGCGKSAETSTDYEAGANEIDGVIEAGWTHADGEDLCSTCTTDRENRGER